MFFGNLFLFRKLLKSVSKSIRKLADELKISFAEAEDLKRTITYEDPRFSQIQKLHQVYYDRVIKEFRQIIESYESIVGTKIDTVYLVGGGSLFVGFDKFFDFF